METAMISIDDRRLLLDTLAEIKELKGEMREFKEHVIGRVDRLEKRNAEEEKNRLAFVSLLIASASLAVSVAINFIKR